MDFQLFGGFFDGVKIFHDFLAFVCLFNFNLPPGAVSSRIKSQSNIIDIMKSKSACTGRSDMWREAGLSLAFALCYL
jgi:hypothetical protein